MKTKLLAVDDNDISLLLIALDYIRDDKTMLLSHGTATDIIKRLNLLLKLDND